jgi:AcrR family transcriptional regulator
MTAVACEEGAIGATVAKVVARSGVSRRTFYELFEDREDCLLASIDEALEQAARRLASACESQRRWRDRMRAGLLALLAFLDDEPRRGRLLVVETLAVGGMALERRRRVLERLIAAVDAGRREARQGSPAPPLAAEGVVGAVLAVIHARMLEGERRSFVELANPLMSMIVLPYLGAVAARRELDRPVASSSHKPAEADRDAFAALHMRLTYRTIRVLKVIATRPGSSNRRIGDFAEIGDPGQISKLLRRLRDLGLIETAEAKHARGEPNAWRLTPRGAELERAIDGQPVSS